MSTLAIMQLNISITSLFYACYTENSLNSNNDETEASPVTGWEVALFTEQQSSDQNMVAVVENKEVGLLLIF